MGEHPKLINEHTFDKVLLLDCTIAELEVSTRRAESSTRRPGSWLVEMLVVEWKRPLHVVVVVDDDHAEERIVTVYEPAVGQWSGDYR